LITIANITSYFSGKYKDAVEIQKHSENLNNGYNINNGYNVNKIWKTILSVIEN